ncbi:MAG: hypothetical protein IJZ35_00225 [Clostridia bacterium]|nr:hypothetical protein [Clostridia bacterium]
MKKTAIVVILLALSVVLLFTGCTRKTDMDNNVTTTNPVTTTRPATENNSLTTGELTTKNGTVESTSKDSALGDVVDGVADGAADVVEGAAEGAKDVGEGIANGARNAKNNMGR